MVSCQYFNTSYIDIDSTIKKHNDKDSFVIYICVDGEVSIDTENGKEHLQKGETILLPASIKDYSLQSKGGKLLEVYV